MAQTIVSSRRSKTAILIAAIAAISLALPSAAHADGKKHGKRHRHHAHSYYQCDDRYYGPPVAHYHGRPRYYPVPVPVVVPAVPVYPPAYPQDYDAYDSKPVVRIGVDWVIGF